MKRFVPSFCVFAVLLALTVAAPADVKVKTKTTTAGRSSESTVYIQGARQRDENAQMPFATILQCDKQRMLQVNDKCKVYMVTPLAAEEEPAPVGKGKSQPAAPPAKSTKGGVVTYTTTMTDTKERKTMLGYAARHIKSSMAAESSPDACSKTSMKSETDGWYADLSVGLTCSRASARPMNPMAMEKPDCQDELRMKRVGGGRLGYPLQQTMTVHTENGDFAMSTEAEEISKEALDAGLFDVPADYKEVTSYQGLMCMPSRESMSRESGMTRETAAPTAHKRTGVLLIGVVGFKNQSGSEISLENLRQRLMAHFTEMNVDTVPLDQTTDSEIHDEATGKHCDYVLYTNLLSINQSAQAKVGGFFGKATGAGSGRGGKFESKVDFRLYAIADHPDKASLVSNASVKEDKDAEETTADALQKESEAVMSQIGKDAAKRGRP